MLAAVSAALQIINLLVGYFRDKKMMDGAVAEAVAAHLKGALNEIQTAQKIRDGVRADLTANPGRVREPDANSRD